ncbi:MAG: hypothetical protein GYB31_10865 [Bacteroidetes bacterium]|nr:hypothetical protein [Bacteroidota bacterium]
MNYTYPTLSLLAILFLMACAPSGENATMEESNPASSEEVDMSADDPTPTYTDTISLKTANEWICNFKDYMRGGVDSAQWTAIQAIGFLIPEADVTQLVAEAGVENLRAYLGLRTDGPSDTLKLVFVGVDENGNDILSLITDFTNPCPPACSGGNGGLTNCQ